MKVLFSHAVWGEEYISNFLRFSLPTQLSKGNLGAFGKDSVFLISTLNEDIPIFEKSHAIRKLKNLVNVEFYTIDKEKITSLKRGSKYSVLTYFQNNALIRSRDFEAVFFGYADALWVDGTYRTVAERLDEGYDAVFSPGYPVVDVDAKARLEAMRTPDDPVLEVGSRDMARMVFDCLHPMAKANITTCSMLGEAPSYLFWPVEGQGLLMRAFHIHPVAFRVRTDTPDFLIPFRTTLDEEFVARLSRYRARIYVSPTSDEMAVCSLMELHVRDYFSNPPRPLTATEVAIFGEAHAGLIHRELALRSVRLQYADGDEKVWQEAERKATQFIGDVMLQLNTPDTVLALESPWAFEARKRRQETYKHWNEKEDLLTLASELFPDVDRQMIIRLYRRRVGLRLLTILYKLKITKLVRWGVLPLLRTSTSSKIRQIVYNAGLPSWRSDDDGVEDELIQRLEKSLGFGDFLSAVIGRSHRQRNRL